MSRRILFIEENPYHREIWQEELHRQGYEVEMATCGSEALYKLGLFRPQLIVTELSLRDREGTDLILELMMHHPEVPIIIHTADCRHEGDFVTWGAEAYLLKSSDTTRLLKEIERVMAAGGREPCEGAALGEGLPEGKPRRRVGRERSSVSVK